MKNFCVIILIVGLCHGASQAAECTAHGRFPNDDTEDCRGFTMCLNGFTNFTQYKLKCPSGSVYSHLEQQCTNSTDYLCLATYNCTSPGNFVNLNGVNCASFVACPQGISGIVTARLVHCTPTMIFDPNAAQCVNQTEYLCPVTLHFPDVVENNLIIKSNVTFNNADNLSVKSIFAISFLILIMM